MTITLCGSTKFEALFHELNEALTVSGRHIVFSLAVFPSTKPTREWYTREVKARLDAAHLAKIAKSDAIVVINRFAYVGESTLREIEFAESHGVRVFCLESWGRGFGLGPAHAESARARARAAGVPDGFVSPIDTSEHGSVWDLLGPAGVLRTAYADRIVALD